MLRLSILTTGQHPLKDYPLAYESSGRVKYRSHSYQALPDPEQVSPCAESETKAHCSHVCITLNV